LAVFTTNKKGVTRPHYAIAGSKRSNMLQETTGNYIQPKYRITQNEIFVQRQNHVKEQKLMVRLRLTEVV
jgi:hypothetical protein